jgi:hypothetical protein
MEKESRLIDGGRNTQDSRKFRAQAVRRCMTIDREHHEGASTIISQAKSASAATYLDLSLRNVLRLLLG